MWRFRILLNFGTWRSFLLGCWVVLCCFGNSEVHSQTQQCFAWVTAVSSSATPSSMTGVWQSASAAVSGLDFAASGCLGDGKGGCQTPGSWTCTPDAPPQASGQDAACSSTFSAGTVVSGGAVSGVVACGNPAAQCAASAGVTVTTTISTGPQAPGTQVQDQNGCIYTINTNPVNIVGCHGGCAQQQATGTGQAATPENPAPAAQSGSDCSSDGNITSCSEAGSGKNCGTFNGDEVCVASIPPGTCVSYASGGVACTASPGTTSVASPPAPTASGGGAASPSGQVQVSVPGSGGSGSVVDTTNYYSAATVAASGTPVASSAGGANVGNAGTASGSGSGSGNGSAPSAANGDCGASGVSCTGAVPAGTWSGDCSDWNSCFQAFYTSVGNAPIVSGAVAIETSWPAGSCDIGTVTMETFNKTFDYGATACQVWQNYIATPLSAILLACWAVVGIFIVLSA